jgi:hypothetical protein
MYHKLHDHRVNCISILAEMQIGAYIDMVEEVYQSMGGIEGQRAPLKTKTGITIRNRLVSDLTLGAIMPPVVIGILLDPANYRKVDEVSGLHELMEIVHDIGAERISVIDGMQRTTAMLEAMRADPTVAEASIRVEFWVSDKLNSLIYRMLVLNTGQVPWEIGRQLETVYNQFLRQIRDELGEDVEVFLLNSQRRRAQAGQYQSRNIIELLLLFSSRKSELDIKDRVAEDFARLDAIETTSHSDFLDYFTQSLRLMSQLDKEFSRLTEGPQENARIRDGKDIFASFPAMVGFCAAVSVEVFDEPGFQINWSQTKSKMDGISAAVGTILEKLHVLDQAALGRFLELQLLEERLTQRSGQVGRFEREFFRRAFSAMFRNSARLTNMEPCWLA